jgi:anti-sigma B factor antagonist
MTGMDGSGGIATIALPERVDSATSRAVEQLIVDALQPGRRLIVDGSAVTYMSAAGVRLLASILHLAGERQARVVLCSFSGPAADCLLVSGFSQLFDIAASVEEATARLRPRLAGTPADRLHPRGVTG